MEEVDVKAQINELFNAPTADVQIENPVVVPDVKVDEPVVVPDKKDEPTDIEVLRQQIIDMATSIQTPDTKIEEVNPLDSFKDDVSFITADNLAKIAEDPLLLNQSFNEVRRQTADAIFKHIPNLIGKAIQTQQAKTELHNSFYGKHPDLIPYKAYVYHIAKDIEKKNEGKTAEEILESIASSAKASLKLVSTAPSKKDGGKPALREVKGGGRPAAAAANVNTEQSQIAELLNL